MACQKKCDNEEKCHVNKNNGSSCIFIVLILYILLAIILSGRIY